MKSRLFRMLQLLALVAALSLPSPAGDALAWPGVEYATVKAYLFGGDSSHSNILRNGKLTTSVEKVARLSAKQAAHILTAIQPEEIRSRMMCYDPHHAFVYFDEFGRPAASMEVCYHCGNYECEPPLPKGKILILPTLLPLFKELGIPAPGDKEFAKLINLEDAAKETPAMKALYGYFGEKTPESAKVWPWREIETVKVLALTRNITIRKPLVHLGELTKDVAREATLTASQKKDAWKCITRPDWTPKDAKLEAYYGEGGEMDVRPIGTQSYGFKWNGGEPTLPRHGLVCFDKAGRPFAWLTISFSDGTYTAYPREGPENFRKPVWHIAPLQKVFEQAGVFNPAEYQKLVEQTLRGPQK